MNKRVELRKIRDFGEVINDTFVFIGQNWKSLLKSYAVICGIFILASMGTSILSQLRAAEYINQAGGAFAMTPSERFGMYGWETVLSGLFLILSYSSIHLTTLAYIAVYREKGDQPAEVEEVWSYFKFYFLRVFGSSILLSIGLVIGFVLCLIPGFYLWPAFSLVLPIIVFENTTLGYAFGRSFQLIKDNYWPTLGILVVSAIIVYVAMMVFVLPLSVFNVTSLLTSGHRLNSTILVATSIAQHICQAFYMMPTIAIAFCYFSLNEQKDNTGLLDRINNLGNPDEGLDPLPTEEY